ncbi:MAG TPA: prefoldin subunit alpha [archaeon]|jgi:prefoldin alpha subunit|nr:prefoldin subunit alpha [archaeon]HPV66487.1 prefoldin subunit alpha [archaeon]
MAKENKEIKTEKTITLDKNQTIQLYQNKEKELQGISQRVEQIDSILQEMQKAEATLKQIKKLKSEEKLLVNLGAGVLMECEVSNKSSIKVMLPGQIMTERSIDEVIEDIDKRNKELQSAKEKLIKSYNQTSQMLEQISNVFREMQLREEQKKRSRDIN